MNPCRTYRQWYRGAESGRDVTQGGAKYNFVTVEGVGFATAADSLSAVKKLLFDDKKVTMAEMLQAISDNFDGHENCVSDS